MATEAFNASGVQSQMTTINGNFTEIGTQLGKANEKITQGLSSPDEAMFGEGATKILATWDENSSSLQDFMKVFEDWSSMVVAMGSKYAELENGTYKVKDESGYASLGETARANRTTSLKTESGIKGFTTANSQVRYSQDKYGIATSVELQLENGKITQKESYKEADGYYKVLAYDPELKKYVYKYYDKDGNEIDETKFNEALANNADYAEKMATARIDEIYSLKAEIEEKRKHINGDSDAQELQSMQERLKELESGEDLPENVKKVYDEKKAAYDTIKQEENKETKETTTSATENTKSQTVEYNGNKYSVALDENGNIKVYDEKGIEITDSNLIASIGAAAGLTVGTSTTSTTSSTITYNDKEYTVNTNEKGVITSIIDDKGKEITDRDSIVRMAAAQKEGTIIQIGSTKYETQKGGQVHATTISGSSSFQRKIDVEYDENGKQISKIEEVKDANGTRTRTWDSNDKLTKEIKVEKNSEGHETTTTNKYEDGKLASTEIVTGKQKETREYAEDGETLIHQIETDEKGEKKTERYFNPENGKRTEVIHYDKDCHSVFESDGKSYTTYAGTDLNENDIVKRKVHKEGENTIVEDYQRIDDQDYVAKVTTIDANKAKKVIEYDDPTNNIMGRVEYTENSDGSRDNVVVYEPMSIAGTKVTNEDTFFAAREYAKEKGYKGIDYKAAYPTCGIYNSDATALDLITHPYHVDEMSYFTISDTPNAIVGVSITNNASSINFYYDKETNLYVANEGLIFEPNTKTIYYDPNKYASTPFGLTDQ